MQPLRIRRGAGKVLPIPSGRRNDLSQPRRARFTKLVLPFQKPMLKPTPFFVADLSARRVCGFKRRAERTEATNLLILRMDDKVGRVLCADNRNPSGHS